MTGTACSYGHGRTCFGATNIRRYRLTCKLHVHLHTINCSFEEIAKFLPAAGEWRVTDPNQEACASSEVCMIRKGGDRR